MLHWLTVSMLEGRRTGGSESASRPPCGFWCLNDKTIKELMSFVKCETGKMACNYVESIYS
jgi:hypothetical protein